MRDVEDGQDDVTYGRTDLEKGKEHDLNAEEQIIEGIVVKHYN